MPTLIEQIEADRAAGTPGDWAVSQTDKWPFELSISPDIISAPRIAYSTKSKTIEDVRNAVGFPYEERNHVVSLVLEQEANLRRIARVPQMEAEIIRLRAGLEEIDMRGKQYAAEELADMARAVLNGKDPESVFDTAETPS